MHYPCPIRLRLPSATVFDNPFDSFHNAVAEAKEEREQLDRLLTISTPRERVLVVAIGVVLVIFATWLFLGQVSKNLILDGILVQSETATPTNDRSVQVQLWVERSDTHRIAPRQSVSLEVATPDGTTTSFTGKILSVSSVPITEEATALSTIAPATIQRIEITLSDEVGEAILVGRDCRILIEIGKQSPISLFGMRQA